MDSKTSVDEPSYGQAMRTVYDMYRGGMTTLMIDIGDRVGLWEAAATFTKEDKWFTSQELGDTAQCNERYVREWLSSMTCAKFFKYNPDGAKFYLRSVYAKLFAGEFKTVVVESKFLSMFAPNVEDYVKAFKEGGGLGYEKFEAFHGAMSHMSAQNFDKNLVQHYLPKAKDIFERLKAGESLRVMDAGCGSGKALLIMAKAFPKSEFFGVDLFTSDAMQKANDAAKAEGITNLTFHVADAAKMSLSDFPHTSAASPRRKFDLICAFDMVHDQAAPQDVLNSIVSCLDDNGTFLMQDISASSNLEDNLERPTADYMYAISTLHCMTVSLAQGGVGLGTMWGRQTAVKMLKEAGFESVDVSLARDNVNDIYVCKKGSSSSKM